MEALLILFALGIAFLTFYLKSPTVIGAAGERRVNSILGRKLNKQDYILFEDLTLPTSNGTTQIDHIVLSRFGIFVIETKNMSGWIFGGKSQKRWTQVMRRKKIQFQNPLHQNYHHIKVVQNLLNIHMDQLENLVVFVGTAKPKTEMPANVFWRSQELYKHILSRTNVKFTENEVHELSVKLHRGSLSSNRETQLLHVQNVRQKVSQRESNLTICPRCSSKMIERSNRKTGQIFMGCSSYPKCSGTRQVK